MKKPTNLLIAFGIVISGFGLDLFSNSSIDGTFEKSFAINDPCEEFGGDADFDGICDDIDDCIGFIDALGVCNGECAADENENGICDSEEDGENTQLTCSDGVDNDGDGLIDCDDPQCQAINNNEGCSTCFNDGSSFADIVLSYDNPCENTATDNPFEAIGVPDYISGFTGYVTLGRGELRLGFSNNTLVNSGDSEPDLFVFEIGPQVEGTFIELRPINETTIAILDSSGIVDIDGDGYYEFGSIGGSTASVDIDAFFDGLSENSIQFDAIKLVDSPGSCGGSTPGADIDAVCALSSLPCTIGGACDDNNPNTIDDAFNSICECVGTPFCFAETGELIAESEEVELDQLEVLISGNPDQNQFIPQDFEVLYLLSRDDLIIEETSTIPQFTVTETDSFLIHSLIYAPSTSSPDFLDLSGLTLGQTSVQDILDFITTFNLCADLDMEGTLIEVITCSAGDADFDGICDAIDLCVGFEDALGVCNGGCPADDNNNGICDIDEDGEGTELTCADGIDNDGDGLIDCEDPECQEIIENLGCMTCFEDGLSFADVVLFYENECAGNQSTNANRALGVPDFTSGNDQYVSIGSSVLRLGFTNNTLTNSGDGTPDLFVFEIGPQVEGTFIELRPVTAATIAQLNLAGILDQDNDGYYEFGSIEGSIESIDIDAFFDGVPPNSVQFDAIKFTDIGGDCDGSTPGADIDAVCALSSLPCIIGNACDDGNPSTVDDVFDNNCNCEGTFVCDVAGGIVSTDDPLLICTGDGEPNPITVDIANSVGVNNALLVTNSNGTILDFSETNVFDFEGVIGSRVYFISNLSWDGTISGLELGENALSLEGDCFELSNSLKVQAFYVNGGTISTSDPTATCSNDGQSDIVSLSVAGDAGQSGVFIVTNPSLAILANSNLGSFNFTSAPIGNYLVWRVSYTGPISLSGGNNVANIQGCFSLSNSIEVQVQSCGTAQITDCNNLIPAFQSELLILEDEDQSSFSSETGFESKQVFRCADGEIVMEDLNQEKKGWVIVSPNPNDGITSVLFQTATSGYASLEVFDLAGRKVDQVYQGLVDSGATYNVQMNRPDLPDGIYLYRLNKTDEIIIGKFIISK